MWQVSVQKPLRIFGRGLGGCRQLIPGRISATDLKQTMCGEEEGRGACRRFTKCTVDNFLWRSVLVGGLWSVPKTVSRGRR